MNHRQKKRPGLKRGPEMTDYYNDLRIKYDKYVNGNELLTIKEAIDAVKTITISLGTTDVGTQKLIGVSRETMQESLKSLQIGPKILARRFNALWVILQATEEYARRLAGSTLTKSESVCKVSVWALDELTVHGVPVDISEDMSGAFLPIWTRG